MALDPREFIRLHAGMPEHPKVDPLSDAAFRCLIEAWCLCRRTRNDGRIPSGTWQKKWKARVRKELVDAGLVLLEKDAAIMRDWLEHQPSVEALEEKRQARVEAGRKGGVRSGESRRGASKPASKPEAKASANASPELEQTVKQNPNQIEPELEIEKEIESSYVGGVSYVGTARGTEPPPRTCPKHRELDHGCTACAATAHAREAWLAELLAATEPPRHCPRHPSGTDEPCRDCQGAREFHARWQRDRKAAAEERRRSESSAQSAAAHEAAQLRAAAMDACPLGCGQAEVRGYLGGRLCDHDPDAAGRAARHLAAMRAELARKKAAKDLAPSEPPPDPNADQPPPETDWSVSVPSGPPDAASQDQPTTQENANA